MANLVEVAALVLLLLLIALPGLYGFHMYWLLFLAHRRRGSVRAAQREWVVRYQHATAEEDWPLVTTQIPLYNELHVARRVIEAAVRMDYPYGRHEVQVLDDSTDETRAAVDQIAAELCAKGHDVKVIRRPTREHYKAGALAHGLQSARGEFVAIFDADFVPDRGFLRRMIPLFGLGDDVCVVQGRWGHLNPDESWITEALSLGLDMHFAIEQAARNWNGLLMSFNGTGGIWRKAAIDDPCVGGWSGDTITEDLDLSYRAQLAGWRMVYCEDEVCPAEIPADVNAIKAQQRRWAIGIMQVARKLLPRVLKSRRLSFAQKLQGVVHLTQYVVAVPMIGVALVGRLLPLLIPHWPGWLNWVCLSFLLAAAGPTLAYISARYVLGGGIPGPLRVLKLMVLGLGLCVNNGLAVLAGLRQKGGEFVRTPKSGRCHGPLPQAEAGLLPQAEAGLSTDRGGGSAYAALRSRLWLIELLLGTFCLAQWIVFLPSDKLGGVFLLMYAIGLFAMGWGSRPDYIRGQPACGTHGVSTALPAPPAPRLTPEPAHPDALAHGVST